MASIIKIIISITAIIAISVEALPLSNNTHQSNNQVPFTAELYYPVRAARPPRAFGTNIFNSEGPTNKFPHYEPTVTDPSHIFPYGEQDFNKTKISTDRPNSAIISRNRRSSSKADTTSNDKPTGLVLPPKVTKTTIDISKNERNLLMLIAALGSPFIMIVPHFKEDYNTNGTLYTS